MSALAGEAATVLDWALGLIGIMVLAAMGSHERSIRSQSKAISENTTNIAALSTAISACQTAEKRHNDDMASRLQRGDQWFDKIEEEIGSLQKNTAAMGILIGQFNEISKDMKDQIKNLDNRVWATQPGARLPGADQEDEA